MPESSPGTVVCTAPRLMVIVVATSSGSERISTMSAVSAATSVPAPIANPTSAWARAGGSAPRSGTPPSSGHDYPLTFSVDYPDRSLDPLSTAFGIITAISILILAAAVVGPMCRTSCSLLPTARRWKQRSGDG